MKRNIIYIYAGTSGKEPTCQCRRHETLVPSRGQEDPLEEGMETHSSILSWRIPWTKKPDGLQSIGSQRVGHDLATNHKHKWVDARRILRFVIEEA